MEADDVDTPGSSTKESSLPTTSSLMPNSSTTLKTILMTLISTKKTKKNRFNLNLILSVLEMMIMKGTITACVGDFLLFELFFFVGLFRRIRTGIVQEEECTKI
ncbi:hypothetical protein ERO13_D07G234275v2 [Gossypium hirsutum]|nr:hypothetical protein ERO13_D07G234275v2 [Gossypium hirsutum]